MFCVRETTGKMNRTSSLVAKTFPFVFPKSMATGPLTPQLRGTNSPGQALGLVLVNGRHLTLASHQLIGTDSTRHALATAGPPYMQNHRLTAPAGLGLPSWPPSKHPK